MDRHKCKLCFRSFSNGRALGGHMRSHMMNLPVPAKGEEAAVAAAHGQLSEEGDSASFLSSPSSSEGDAEEKGVSYGLRENPKRSIRVVDPEFSFAVDAGSVVLQDRESETESSKNPTRRRSKRTRKPDRHHQQQLHHHYNVFKRLQEKKVGQPESWTEAEPVSSISGSTTEEDVAFWLMMLSRDKWTKQQGGYEEEEEDEEEEEEEDEEEEEESMEETDDSEAVKFPKNRNRGNYKCETCNKVFRSYQALGGHRASHKKIKVSVSYNNPHSQLGRQHENAAATTSGSMAERKIHECPVCFRVFSSGQALGGHKRSHVTAYSIPPKTPEKKLSDSLIDLNLPAPFEEDDLSQIELSAVSDADFVNPIRHRQ
ncbi:unnamed protein product [Citrullus colocynthis]|uniref:C2H2-type domain-containing protein n=1 Tax=Citrullus colocynthis TaxID=252529 RepID=A0ABP0YI37_9ROSI